MLLSEHHTSEANISNNGNATEKREKRGIIYLSSIPPFMKPAKLRHIMLQYGEVDRIFLQPEGLLCNIILYDDTSVLNEGCGFEHQVRR